ncbi:hypothetical protein V8E54_001685 [Elaphomyces granulatus]
MRDTATTTTSMNDAVARFLSPERRVQSHPIPGSSTHGKPKSRSLLIEELQSQVDSLREQLQDSENTVRKQRIQLLKYRADPYANYQTPDTEIDGRYQHFIGVTTQAARKICDATGYDTNVMDSVIGRMMNLENDESTVTELKALSGLLKSPHYSHFLHRSTVAMILFLSLERWAFPPRCFSTGISPDQNGSFSSVLKSFLADIREDTPNTEREGRLQEAENWRLETVLRISRSRSGIHRRERNKKAVLNELLKLFAIPEDHSELQQNLTSLTVDAYDFSDFLHNQKSVHLFERLNGPYVPTHMDFGNPRQHEQLMELRVNIEVEVCIYPALAKIVPIEPFICFVSKGKALYGPSDTIQKSIWRQNPEYGRRSRRGANGPSLKEAGSLVY